MIERIRSKKQTRPTTEGLQENRGSAWCSQRTKHVRTAIVSIVRKGILMASKSSATDQPVLAHIQQLIEEEHRFFALAERGEVGEKDRQRQTQVQVELDQCWDLLRQPRALREVGSDPHMAHVRPAQVVESTSNSCHPMRRLNYGVRPASETQTTLSLAPIHLHTALSGCAGIDAL
jgi:hypothetical protein